MRTCNKLQAALGLCVGVGSFSDPWSVQGMAHFLEHMVFMGSEKYPKENDFDAFIKRRGGSDNAGTDCEITTFYFECQEKYLRETVDKFSQFFISPLMKKEAMTREREAIFSEFQMAVTSDASRLQELLCCLANSGNPARKFSWGNLITLRDNIADDDLYKAVHDFRKRHYSAHRMTLAIQARMPMETLESLVCDAFSAVPSNGLPPDDFKEFADLPFKLSEFNRMYWVKPVKDMHQVKLSWALPSMLHMYRSKPDDYMSSLIGHEGKGSLLAYLRKNVWALDIFSGAGSDGCEHNSMFTLFSITIVLTDVGLTHLHEVLNAVFGYIKMLQKVGPSERFFRELQTIEETTFRFAEELPAVEYVENLAENMQLYPPEDYITGSELYFEYDPEAIKKCLDALKPDTVNIMVSSKDSGREFDKTEYWFKTEYCVCDIPNDWLESWLSIEPDQSFSLPEPNIFLTSDFSLLPFPDQQDDNKKYPVKVQDDEFSEVWYRRDCKFKLPQAFFYFYLISPLPLTSPQDAAMLNMYVEILKQLLVEELYPADVADLSWSITPGDKGIVLKFSGFNQKLPLLLEAVVNYMAEFESSLTPSLFEALKEVQRRYFYNSCLKPEKLEKDLRFSVLLHVHWNALQKHAAMSKIAVTELKAFARHFVERLYVQSLVQGNISERQAVDACERIVGILKCAPLLPNTHPQIRVTQIPLGEHCCRVKSFNSRDPNSTVTNYYQSGPITIKNLCILDLLMMLMEEPVFDILRTKEQLGYHVYSCPRHTFGILGFSVTVNCQAGKNSVEHVDARIEAFLKTFSKTLKKIRGKELEEARSSLIKLKQLSDVCLKEEVSRNWDQITSGNYMFDQREREVSCVEDIKMPEIKKWYSDHVLCGTKTNLRKLSIQVVGSAGTSKTQEHELPLHTRVNKPSINHQPLQPNEMQKWPSGQCDFPSELPLQFIAEEYRNGQPNEYFITDIEDFKNGLFVYPVHRICE
ncbi:nardilysin isoform X2 [Zootermopsis nevadensis]|uniref:nardilysin isoform X2 n=1 Tax=Zootermopsis nevadensis TaxID=136037 RepID=UPI000B8E488A|nr:nardilysin isoform X2 [Zootermopsis nevadensis]